MGCQHRRHAMAHYIGGRELVFTAGAVRMLYGRTSIEVSHRGRQKYSSQAAQGGLAAIRAQRVLGSYFTPYR